jgi:hypothetical protein
MGRTNWVIWSTGAISSLAIALVSSRYLLQVGPIPPLIFTNLFRDPWLPVHVAGAATALLIGPVQFPPALRARLPRVHRWIGRSYVFACLLGGLAGFILALGASTGPVSTAGFGALAVLWISTTTLAWQRAMQRRFVEHRAWMIRSFALTFAAVTLRIYLPILEQLPIPFDDGYRAISFLCWVPNLLVAEMYLRGKRQHGGEIASAKG